MSKIKLLVEIDEGLYEAYKGRPPMLGDAGMDMIAQAIANGIPYEPKDAWISVSGRLPDKEGKCLVFTDYGDVTMDSYRDGMFVCNLGNVTHWQPLPKAPESEATNETDN